MNSGLLLFIKSTVKHNSGGSFSNKHLVTNSLPSYTNTDRESDWLASWFWEWIPDNNSFNPILGIQRTAALNSWIQLSVAHFIHTSLTCGTR